MSLIQFKSGHAVPLASIISITPYYTLTRERNLKVNAGIGVGEPTVCIEETHAVLAEWELKYHDTDESGAETVSVLSAGSDKFHIACTDISLDQFVADNSEKMKLEADDVDKILANIRRVFTYHSQIANFVQPDPDALIPTNNQALVGEQIDDPQHVQANLNARIKKMAALLGEDGFGITGGNALSPVNGYPDLEAKMVKFGLFVDSDTESSLKQVPAYPVM